MQTYISLNHKTEVGIAAPATQSTYRRSGQVQPRLWQKTYLMKKKKRQRQSTRTIQFIWTKPGNFFWMSPCSRARHASFLSRSEVCCWQASNSSTIWPLSWTHKHIQHLLRLIIAQWKHLQTLQRSGLPCPWRSPEGSLGFVVRWAPLWSADWNESVQSPLGRTLRTLPLPGYHEESILEMRPAMGWGVGVWQHEHCTRCGASCKKQRSAWAEVIQVQTKDTYLRPWIITAGGRGKAAKVGGEGCHA